MKPIRLLTAALYLLVASSLVACGDDAAGDDDDDDLGIDAGNDSDAAETTRTLTPTFTGLPELGEDAVYEGWIIVDGAPVTTGRFTVDAAGAPTPSSFELDAADADAATAFVLTIEPATGDDPAPSDVHILAGDIRGGTASLTVDHGAAIGTDFASAAGTFLLATPSSAADDDNDQGIWWIDGGDAGLTLPALPDGWVYEGWIVDADGPISTGRFTDPAAADSDGAGPDAGPEDTPPFPGQDFIDPALVLTSLTAVISVEPDPDDAPTPFAIKPLIDTDITDVPAPATQPMTNMAASTLPTGSIAIE